jgi:hypothetical protein
MVMNEGELQDARIQPSSVRDMLCHDDRPPGFNAIPQYIQYGANLCLLKPGKRLIQEQDPSLAIAAGPQGPQQCEETPLSETQFCGRMVHNIVQTEVIDQRGVTLEKALSH